MYNLSCIQFSFDSFFFGRGEGELMMTLGSPYRNNYCYNLFFTMQGNIYMHYALIVFKINISCYK